MSQTLEQVQGDIIQRVNALESKVDKLIDALIPAGADDDYEVVQTEELNEAYNELEEACWELDQISKNY